MKIGIDLRGLAFGASDAATQWLRDTLTALFARPEPHTYCLFHTVFNYHLFPTVPPHVTRHTLPLSRFNDDLLDRVAFEGDFDILLRSSPLDVLDRFPLERQIVCVADFAHEANPKPLAPDDLRARRKSIRAHQTGAGALAVPNEAVRDELRSDPWTTIDDVFVMPADDGAEALAGAFKRMAQRAQRSLSARVSTPPVVSIVTPSFNQGAFIRQTIDSVLNQDYPHIDYRVVDGGSTDDTVAVLKSYGARVRWVSEKDRGQTHAINKGMAEARGEIRAYLNSDDLLRPGAVRRVVEHFRDRPGCDLVYGSDAFIDAGGTYLGMYPTADYSFAALADNCCISQPATFWRKRLSDRIGPFDEALHLVMDYEYWLRADRAGATLEHIPDVLAHTRMHRQTKTSGGGTAAAFHDRYFREVFDVCLRHAGYVSSRYVFGWLDAAVFNTRPWTRRYEDLITRVVQTWYHNRYRCKKKPWRAAVSVVANERRYVAPFLRRQVAAMNPRNWFRAPAQQVKLAADLWLGPELEFAHAGGPVRLTGVPARNSVLRIYRGTAELVAVELCADEPTDVCVDAAGGPLRITFSDAELLPDGRRVSFKLHGTTLFRDCAAA